MLKTDKMFIDNIIHLLENGYTSEDFEVRPVWHDGSPAHTIYTTFVTEEYDISKGEFPITTLRPVAWKAGIKEILWIYQDQSNDLALLKEKYNIRWWDEWDIGDGTIGQRYGATIRKYGLIDKLIKGLKESPMGRRHIMNMYQYADLEETKGLHPCAYSTTWMVRADGYLDMKLTQRSNDYLVAGHINKIQYVALMMMIAKAVGLKPGKFVHVVDNLHIYDRHIKAARILRDRGFEIELKEALLDEKELHPILVFNPKSDNFYDFTIDDFEMVDYKPMKKLPKFELAI